jgi:uncharacterized protein (DUF58 family)
MRLWTPAWLRRREARELDTDASLLRRVRRLELRTREFVDSLFTGEYHSVFIGRGLEFSHVRGYQSGDDVRTIDWKVTARRGTPFVRRFVEERDLLVTLVVDVSASARFAPGPRSVAEAAAEIVAALSFAATRNSDRLSLVLASDRVERIVPPGTGRRHAVRLLAQFLSHRPLGRRTDLVPALDAVARAKGGRALVFLLSDFILGEELESFESTLGRAARRHDFVALRLAPPDGDVLPPVGWVEMTDPETGRRILSNGGARKVQDRMRSAVGGEREAVREVLSRAGAELVEVDTGGDPLAVLAGFLRGRRGTPR